MAYTQADRPLRIHTPLGADVLLARNFRGREAISRPFHWEVEAVSVSQSVDVGQLLRQPVHVAVGLRDGQERIFHGRVKAVKQLGRIEGLSGYRIEIAPWLWLLTLSSDCKIHQAMTVPEILEQVFNDLGYRDYSLKLYKNYPQREYCVQYRESHFQFVSRLMEEEGIFYFFEHSADRHLLVMADANQAIQPCPDQAFARMAMQGGTFQEEDVLLNVSRTHAIQTGKYTHTDYNFETPASNLEASVEGEEPPEQYDYPGKYAERDDGDRLARIRLEEQEARRVVIEGEGNVRTLASGHKFELREHYLRDMNAQYLITSVTHSMDTGSYRAGGEQRNEYSCGFEAIPVATPYRPPRVTRKPRIHGTQTAVVVGSPGEEIWLDEYGRVRLHFHWDRVGQRKEESSCWVRVSQGWAGKNWGMAHWPRVGQEVVVSFLEGDPDRPLVTGRVYNADQMPPYELPAKGEISGIKSNSSLGGSGYNEFSFDDTAGSELIVLHGEKDWSITIKNDETQSVGRNRTETVQQNEEVTVGVNRSVSIGSNDELNVGSMLRITAGTSIELINGANSIKMNSMGITIQSAGVVTIQGSMVKIN